MITQRKLPWKWIGIGAVGFLLLRSLKGLPSRKLPENARINYAMQPTQGTAGQYASLATYRLISNRRDGLEYTPVEEETDKVLVFTMPKTGTVTRNVLVEGGRKLVEIA